MRTAGTILTLSLACLAFMPLSAGPNVDYRIFVRPSDAKVQLSSVTDSGVVYLDENVSKPEPNQRAFVVEPGKYVLSLSHPEHITKDFEVNIERGSVTHVGLGFDARISVSLKELPLESAIRLIAKKIPDASGGVELPAELSELVTLESLNARKEDVLLRIAKEHDLSLRIGKGKLSVTRIRTTKPAAPSGVTRVDRSKD